MNQPLQKEISKCCGAEKYWFGNLGEKTKILCASCGKPFLPKPAEEEKCEFCGRKVGRNTMIPKCALCPRHGFSPSEVKEEEKCEPCMDGKCFACWKGDLRMHCSCKHSPKLESEDWKKEFENKFINQIKFGGFPLKELKDFIRQQKEQSYKEGFKKGYISKGQD